MTTLLPQAQQALKAGDTRRARQLLHQAIRQNPDDHRVWLYLASITASPQTSLEYVERAEMLRPHDPLVHKARAWAVDRVAATKKDVSSSSTPVVAEPSPSTVVEQEATQRVWQPILLWGSVAMVVTLLLITAVLLTWRSFSTETVLAETVMLSPTVVLQQVVSNEQPVATRTAVPSMTPTTPARIDAKSVGQNGQAVRATWTLTPTPTNTPTPTPTYRPTYISPNNRKPAGRPLGVGANERWIDVDLSRQLLQAYQGNDLVYETYISSGTYEHPTVTGQFRIWLEYESQTMDGTLLGYDYYLENVPYVMYFYEDYALHGTFWHNNFGTPMSHGCVNLRTSDAQWVFNWAGVGTVVNVHY